MKKACMMGVLGLAILTIPSQAGMIVFDTGIGNATSFRPSDFGAGQPILVMDCTIITNMAMQVAMPNGGNIEYMIWNASNSVLLFSEEQAVAASTTPDFVVSSSFSFDVLAGDTYFFGVIGDNNLYIQYITPSKPITQNGLTALLTGNSNYQDFKMPAVVKPGFVEIPLQLYAEAAEQQTPEPASWLTLGAGAIFLFMKAHRRQAVP